jgi:hypothetical protein
MVEFQQENDHKSFVSRTLKPISIVQVGNQILAPLTAGLEYSQENKAFGMAASYGKLPTNLPLGTARGHTLSFTNPASRRAPEEPDEFPISEGFIRYKISPYTEALATLHDQLVDIGFNTGKLLDVKKALPDPADSAGCAGQVWGTQPKGVRAIFFGFL